VSFSEVLASSDRILPNFRSSLFDGCASLFEGICPGLIPSSGEQFLSGDNHVRVKEFVRTRVAFLQSFVQKRWYIQQQMAVSYLPITKNRCVYADYKLKEKKNFWGYDVDVRNHAEDVAPPHKETDSGSFLNAKIVDKDAGKLAVAPFFLPYALSGDYWILAYDEAQGYALISGGAPKKSFEGGCRTGTGTNGSGLWIFTRQRIRDEALVQKVRGIAAEKGFDLSVLNDVDQTECNEDA